MPKTEASTVSIVVNGNPVNVEVEDRLLLSDLLREHLGLKGTHVGCDTSQCGACVVHLDGQSVKSCTVLARQCEGSNVTTIEGLADGEKLHPMQQAFKDNHGLQCGFCTAGMVMSALDLVSRNPDPDDDAVRRWLDGNLCRCTGYQNIILSIKAGAKAMREG